MQKVSAPVLCGFTTFWRADMGFEVKIFDLRFVILKKNPGKPLRFLEYRDPGGGGMSKVFSKHLKMILVGLIAAMLFSACAPSGPVVKIESPASPVNVNDTVTVPIKVENITDLIAMEIHLSFDPGKLEVVELKNGGFVRQDYLVQNTFDNANGTIDYAVAQIGGSPSVGSGTLLEVVFRVKDKGDAQISFRKTQAAPSGAIFSNSQGVGIQVSLANGNLTAK